MSPTRRKVESEEPEASEPPAGEDSPAPAPSTTEVKEVVMNLLRDLGLVGGDSDGGEEGAGAPEPSDAPPSPRQQEADMEREVRSWMDKIQDEKELRATVDRLKAEVEKPPAQVRTLTRLLWGSDV
jgi:hypothetical protein